jgi:hypothetical protein
MHDDAHCDQCSGQIFNGVSRQGSAASLYV